jgi:N-glycosylase/DNA lyase
MAQTLLRVSDYDLDATLNSGQAFRWQWFDHGWEGVIGTRWVRLAAHPVGLAAETAAPVTTWDWLVHYLQTDVELPPILKSFPADPPLQAAVAACRGLRLLRQDPWECLASFLLSSTKQIRQIRQIIETLCQRYGARLPGPSDRPVVHAFPIAEALAAASEAELRACKMGFRAPSLRAVAQAVDSGRLDLAELGHLPTAAARARLMEWPGVGEKIANCVLLFGYGAAEAFPVDVWVRRALQRLYFPRRRVTAARLRQFAATHFGPHAGYAQQYLFHYMRVHFHGQIPQTPPPI